VSISGRSFSGRQAADSGPSPQHSEPPYLTLFYAQIIFLLSLSPGKMLTLFYPMHLSISGQSFSGCQAANSGPLASTFRISLLALFYTQTTVYSYYLFFFLLNQPLILFYSLVMSISGWFFSWRQAADNGSLASTFRTSMLTLFYAQIIFLLSLSPGKTLTLFYTMHLSILGQSFSGCQAADSGPLASTFRTSLLVLFYTQTTVYSYYLFFFLLNQPLTLFYSLDVSIYGQSFSGRQAADSGPSHQQSKLIFNPVLCPDYILTRSLSLSSR
jgi:hypothetical protein